MQVCNEIERENYSPVEINAGDTLIEKVNYPGIIYIYIYIYIYVCVCVCIYIYIYIYILYIFMTFMYFNMW